MKRRNFITKTATILPFLLGRFPVSVYGSNSFWSSLVEGKKPGKVLVLIQLDGGNDGLNTIIPLDQYSRLVTARENILIPEKKVLRLKNKSDTGLHPSLIGLQELYNNQMAMFIQGVGYPNQDFSHFKSIDIWMSGSTAAYSATGWLGRVLNKSYPDYPAGYPNATSPHPLAIRVGAVAPKITMGEADDFGVVVSPSTISSPAASNTSTDPLPNTMAGMAVHSIREVNRLNEVYSPVIKSASEGQQNLSKKYPQDGVNYLADQLKIVARLIGGGLQTQLYILTQTGYDTHAAQSDSSEPTRGVHANLLRTLSEAITGFQDDISLMGKQDEVIGMTFSEFGRRIISNGGFGTDHGSSQPIIMFGAPLKGGIIGNNPEIPKEAKHDDNLQLQYDFRDVYASVLKGWFGTTENEIARVLEGKRTYLDLFKH